MHDPLRRRMILRRNPLVLVLPVEENDCIRRRLRTAHSGTDHLGFGAPHFGIFRLHLFLWLLSEEGKGKRDKRSQNKRPRQLSCHSGIENTLRPAQPSGDEKGTSSRKSRPAAASACCTENQDVPQIGSTFSGCRDRSGGSLFLRHSAAKPAS